MGIKTEYLVDEQGQKRSVVFSLQNYLKLMEYMEDLEDSVDLKRAKETARGFKDFSTVVHQLRNQKRLQ